MNIRRAGDYLIVGIFMYCIPRTKLYTIVNELPLEDIIKLLSWFKNNKDPRLESISKGFIELFDFEIISCTQIRYKDKKIDNSEFFKQIIPNIEGEVLLYKQVLFLINHIYSNEFIKNRLNVLLTYEPNHLDEIVPYNCSLFRLSFNGEDKLFIFKDSFYIGNLYKCANIGVDILLGNCKNLFPYINKSNVDDIIIFLNVNNLIKLAEKLYSIREKVIKYL